MEQDLLSTQVLLSLLDKQRYGVEYQPIISPYNSEIMAYESLSRFYGQDGQAIRPDLVYASFHHNPLSLFRVEYQQKQLQLSEAPTSAQVFTNLDQDSYFASGVKDGDNPFLRLFLEYQKTSLVVELIENSELNDAKMSLSMIQTLNQNGIKTALDDLCGPHSMISTSVLSKVDFLKLDKEVVRNKSDKNLQLLVQSMIQFAHGSGKQVILEGIETEEDLTFARQLEVDWVQGFLYRPQFILVR